MLHRCTRACDNTSICCVAATIGCRTRSPPSTRRPRAARPRPPRCCAATRTLPLPPTTAPSASPRPLPSTPCSTAAWATARPSRSRPATPAHMRHTMRRPCRPRRQLLRPLQRRSTTPRRRRSGVRRARRRARRRTPRRPTQAPAAAAATRSTRRRSATPHTGCARHRVSALAEATGGLGACIQLAGMRIVLTSCMLAHTRHAAAAAKSSPANEGRKQWVR